MSKYAISRDGKQFLDIYGSQGAYDREVEEGGKILWGLIFLVIGLIVGYVISQSIPIQDAKAVKVTCVLLWGGLLSWGGYKFHWIIEGVLLYSILAGVVFGCLTLLWWLV